MRSACVAESKAALEAEYVPAKVAIAGGRGGGGAGQGQPASTLRRAFSARTRKWRGQPGHDAADIDDEPSPPLDHAGGNHLQILQHLNML